MTTLSDHMVFEPVMSARSKAGFVMHAINPKSQEGEVLLHLIRVGHITQLQALELYRVHRLASRISALKLKYGVDIQSNRRLDATGTRYNEYSL